MRPTNGDSDGEGLREHRGVVRAELGREYTRYSTINTPSTRQTSPSEEMQHSSSRRRAARTGDGFQN